MGDLTTSPHIVLVPSSSLNQRLRQSKSPILPAILKEYRHQAVCLWHLQWVHSMPMTPKIADELLPRSVPRRTHLPLLRMHQVMYIDICSLQCLSKSAKVIRLTQIFTFSPWNVGSPAGSTLMAEPFSSTLEGLAILPLSHSPTLPHSFTPYLTLSLYPLSLSWGFATPPFGRVPPCSRTSKSILFL